MFHFLQIGDYDIKMDNFGDQKTGSTREMGLLRTTDDTAAPSRTCDEFCPEKGGAQL